MAGERAEGRVERRVSTALTQPVAPAWMVLTATDTTFTIVAVSAAGIPSTGARAIAAVWRAEREVRRRVVAVGERIGFVEGGVWVAQPPERRVRERREAVRILFMIPLCPLTP